MSPARVVLTRERLREALQGRAGQVFDTATSYRRAVDERSLTEALPPMSADLLADVAEALNQMEEYRRELEEYVALERAVAQFNQRYQHYAATQARRQARSLRGAQTGFDNASRELHEGRAALQAAQATEAQARATQAVSEAALAAGRTRLEELQNDPAMTSAKQLEKAELDATRRRLEAEQALRTRSEMQTRHEHEQQASRARSQRAELTGRALVQARADAAQGADRAGLAAPYNANPMLRSNSRGKRCSMPGSATWTACGSSRSPAAPKPWPSWPPGPPACKARTRPAPHCKARNRPPASVWRNATLR